MSMTWTYDLQISFSPEQVNPLTPEQEREMEKTLMRAAKEGVKASRSKK